MQNYHMFFVLIFMCLLLLPEETLADIYMFEDKNGLIHFTDTPLHSGYKIIIKSSASGSGNFLYDEGIQPRRVYSHREIREKIIASSLKNDLDPDLVKAVIKVESGFDPNAVSKKGAIGLMQLMPETANEYMVEDPFDPLQNIDGGIRYLKKLYDLYQGNLDYTLAAYNAGEEAVYNYKGIPPYKETKNYVKKVKKHYKLIKARRYAEARK